MEKKQVICFDGVCGLCNGFVDFVMAHDHQKQFFFSPLQEQWCQKNLPAQYLTNLSTIVFYQDGKLSTKSDAAIDVVEKMGGIFWFARIARIVPKFIRDKVYDFVASNRYQWFGKKDICRLPTPEERSRFLL